MLTRSIGVELFRSHTINFVQIPLKPGSVKTAVKSIDELRARHAQFKDSTNKDVIPPSPVFDAGSTAATAAGARAVGRGAGNGGDIGELQKTLQPHVPRLQSGEVFKAQTVL